MIRALGHWLPTKTVAEFWFGLAAVSSCVVLVLAWLGRGQVVVEPVSPSVFLVGLAVVSRLFFGNGGQRCSLAECRGCIYAQRHTWRPLSGLLSRVSSHRLRFRNVPGISAGA